jgi:hypothetical protein
MTTSSKTLALPAPLTLGNVIVAIKARGMKSTDIRIRLPRSSVPEMAVAEWREIGDACDRWLENRTRSKAA